MWSENSWRSCSLESVLRLAAPQLHYQGVALPHLVRRHDLAGLVAVVDNRKLPEAARLSVDARQR